MRSRKQTRTRRTRRTRRLRRKQQRGGATPYEIAENVIRKWVAAGNPDAGLQLAGLGLTSLPPLPDGLRVLACSGNQLTELPPLPKSLLILMCNNNELTYLPDLPPKLEVLECNNNKLSALPMLPKSLIALSCFRNNFPEKDFGETIQAYQARLLATPGYIEAQAAAPTMARRRAAVSAWAAFHS